MTDTFGDYDEIIARLPTDRELRFRAWHPDDAPAVLRACSEPSTQRWVAPFRGYDAAMAADFVGGAPEKWAARQHLRLCLTDASGAVLGSGDLDDLTFAHGRSELGWWVAPDARGRGLGVRLGRLLVRAGFEGLGLHRLTAEIAPGNHASRWVAAGSGLHLESVGRDVWVGVDGVRSDRETWRLLATEEPLEAQPELTAGALHLRPWRPSDAAEVFAACQDPEIQRWTTVPVPYRLDDAEGYVGPGSLGNWARGEGANFAVLDSVTGSLVATQGAEVIQWRALPGNAASWRVAEKLGFQRQGTTRGTFVRRGTTGPRLDDETASLLAGELRAT